MSASVAPTILHLIVGIKAACFIIGLRAGRIADAEYWAAALPSESRIASGNPIRTRPIVVPALDLVFPAAEVPARQQ
jgi:hypothetical protein